MRIAIITSNTGITEVLRRVILRVPGNEIVWMAESGGDALPKCAETVPDLILVDLHSGDDTCIPTIKQITGQYGCAVVLMTESIEKHAGRVFEAMGAGARDVIKTPGLRDSGLIDGGDELSRKIAAFSKIIGKPAPKPMRLDKLQTFMPTAAPLVAIGSSTGGPKVLANLFSNLPPQLNCAVIVIQHMDTGFSSNLAEWLNEQGPIPVHLAREGDRPRSGTALVAGGDKHLLITADLTLTYSAEPVDCPYRPSIDQFFQSLAQYWPRRDTAILLTGMGKDGAQGLLTLRQIGWKTMAQDEETSSVYGMPKAAAQMGAAAKILSPDEILSEILAFCTNFGRKK